MTNLFTKTRLYCPGPTPVGHAAQSALLNTDVYHRTQDFYAILKKCRKSLAAYFGLRKEEPLILTCSGTGAMEAAVVNLTNASDQIAVIAAGKFGERWEKIASAYQCQVATLKIPEGESPTPDQVASFVKKHSTCKALFFQANETSTGVALPVEEICAKVREIFQGLIVVDAISGLAAHPMEMDAWGIDCVVSGSQKGFGIPPGLAFVALSERGWKSITNRSRFYFDLPREKKNQADGQTAFTPAINLVLALEAALEQMARYSVAEIVTHHQRLAHAARAAGLAIGLEPFAKSNPSNALTSFVVPQGMDGSALVRKIRESDGAIFAGGQDHLKGKIIRLAHLGFMDRLDLVAAVAALEFGLSSSGHKFTIGAGTQAATKALTI